MHLVIGGRGLIGTAVVEELRRRDVEHIATTRSSELRENEFFLDLLNIPPWPFHRPDVLYLVAAMQGGVDCESNPTTYRVNVDAPIALAKLFHKSFKSFVVYVSSGAVECAGGMAYARQKAAVEGYIHTINGGILRAYRCTKERAPEIAKEIIDIGLERRIGVTRWM